MFSLPVSHSTKRRTQQKKKEFLRRVAGPSKHPPASQASVAAVDSASKLAVSCSHKFIKNTTSIAMLSPYSLASTRDAEDAILRQELQSIPDQNIPLGDFLRIIFGIEAPTSPEASIISGSWEFGGLVQKYREALKTGKEEDLYQPFADMVNHILPKNLLQYRTVATTPLTHAHNDAIRKPDGVLLRRDRVGFKDKCTPKWVHALMVFEFKKRASAASINPQNKPSSSRSTPRKPPASSRTGLAGGLQAVDLRSNKPTRLTTATASSARSPEARYPEGKRIKLTDREQLTSYALEMMSTEVHRRHAIAMYINGSQAELWYFDRSGAIGTLEHSFDFLQSIETFVTLVLGLGRASPTQFGYEPYLNPQDGFISDTIGIPINIPSRSSPLYLQQRLSHTRGLFGRGTVVFRVRARIDNAKSNDAKAKVAKPYAAKLSWQLTSRAKEDKVLDHLQVTLKGTDAVKHIPLVHWAADLATLKDGFRGRFEELPHFLPFDLDRTLRLIVMRPFCVPLYTVKGMPEFKLAYISLVKAHKDICELGHMIHGDISISNLMVRADDLSHGILIDFDLAVGVGKRPFPQESAFQGDRSASLPFLALNRLSDTPPPLEYSHDLESFIWSLWWICLQFDDGAKREHGYKPLELWYTKDWYSIQSAKRNFPGEASVHLAHISPQFVLVRGWLKKLSAKMAAGNMRHQTLNTSEPQPGQFHDYWAGRLTYASVMEILDPALTN